MCLPVTYLQPVVQAGPQSISAKIPTPEAGTDTAEDCWSEGLVQIGALVVITLLTKGHKLPPPPMFWPRDLIPECEQEIGIPVGNEDNCFTSQAGLRLKIGIDLGYGEKVPVNFFKRFYLLILERGREGERKGEKYHCAIAFCAPPTGDLTWPTTQECALTGNQMGTLRSQAGAQSTEPHQPKPC